MSAQTVDVAFADAMAGEACFQRLCTSVGASSCFASYLAVFVKEGLSLEDRLRYIEGVPTDIFALLADLDADVLLDLVNLRLVKLALSCCAGDVDVEQQDGDAAAHPHHFFSRLRSRHSVHFYLLVARVFLLPRVRAVENSAK